MVTSTGEGASPYVDVARLWLAEGACEEVAARCESLRETLSATIQQLSTFAPVGHTTLGDCEEGRGWRRVIDGVTAAPTGSLTWVLHEHQTVLSEFADAIRRIGLAYRLADHDSADSYMRLRVGATR